MVKPMKNPVPGILKMTLNRKKKRNSEKFFLNDKNANRCKKALPKVNQNNQF